MSKSKVTLRVNTIGAKSGDTIEVDSDVAKSLVDNGHALPAAVSQSKKD